MIFIGLFAVLTISCVITNNGRYRNGRLFACAIVGICLLCLMGLRHINYGGVDTQVYARDFTRIVERNYSLADIFKYFYKDYGFYLFAKIVSLFTSNVNCWIFICAMPYICVVVYIIYKYSDDIFLSFIMFMSLGFYLYDFQLMRHVFSMAFVILALESLQKGYVKKYFILTIIASTFHVLAAVILIAYPIRRVKLGIKQLAWIFGGALVVLMFILQRSLLVNIISIIPFLSSSRIMNFAESGSAGTISNFLIQMLFIAIAWFYMQISKGSLNYDNEKRKIENEKESKTPFCSNGIISLQKNHHYITSPIDYRFLFNIAVVGAIFYLAQLVVGESYRIAQYFSIYVIILIPNLLHMVKDKKTKLIIYAVIIVFLVRHFFGGIFLEGSVYNPYQFFWEGTQSLY